MNKNDWRRESTPQTVKIQCEDTNRVIEADVISLNQRLLVAAIQGVKITLVSQKENGIYTGRPCGLDLVYKR